MNNAQYKSVGTILWKVLKNPLCNELSLEEASEYALEFIKLLGAPVVYLTKLEHLKLNCYKAELPCDLLYLEGVRYLDCDNIGSAGGPVAMRESSNIYHLDTTEFDNTNGRYLNHGNNEFTYKIQKGIIFTSMEEGTIELAYKGIALDEDGYPLIPDNQDFMLGCEYYIMSRYLEGLWLMGKITDKAFEYINQKRYFYTPAAFTSLQMPSIDKMETIMNGLNRLIINDTAHENFFKKYGEKERIKRYK